MSLLCALLASPKVPSQISKGTPSLATRRQSACIRCEAASKQGNDHSLTYAVPKSKKGSATTDAFEITTDTSQLEPPSPSPVVPVFGRSSFPSGFTFGAATSALQIEGALHEGGRGPSIWEAMISKYPDKIRDLSTPAVACDSYHRYKDDVKLLKQAGMDAYRFSIAWTRILPKGSLAGGISKDGIKYYNDLIDELLANGIEPYVTLFHWDVPQGLEDAYGGFLSKKIVEDFKDFAEICFRSFGDRVKHWITLNEPHMFIRSGYDIGSGAPGRCSSSLGCPAGDSATEPYIVAHNMILAHATAVRLYKEKFQDVHKGVIGITLDVIWYMPYCKQDISAQERGIDFQYGWYMDPLVYGDYPFIMRALVRERLPTFTEEEIKLVKGSYDFVGLNYYTSYYVKGLPFTPANLGSSYSKDSFIELTAKKEGEPIGKLTRTDGFYSVPEGIFDLLLYTKEKYKKPVIYITENGCFDPGDHQLTFVEALRDEDRIQYYASHLAKVLKAIRLGVKVKGFFAWSLMDNWEWTNGFLLRVGIAYMDSCDRQNRYQKDSFKWFNKFLKL